jgi:hypothetical protein
MRDMTSCTKSVARLAGRGIIEPVSTHLELNLWHQNADIDNWRPETGALNSSGAAKNRKNCASETQQRLPNARECREYFCSLDMAHRDWTGWLGRLDSNQGMAESKSAALPLGYAPMRDRRADHNGRAAANQMLVVTGTRRPTGGLGTVRGATSLYGGRAGRS